MHGLDSGDIDQLTKVLQWVHSAVSDSNGLQLCGPSKWAALTGGPVMVGLGDVQT